MAKKQKFDPFKDLVISKRIFRIKPPKESSLVKKHNINLRINVHTYLGLKKKAAKLGLPYQTLAGSILHQYASL